MKQLRKYLKHLASPFTLGVVVTLLAAYVSVTYYAGREQLNGKDDKGIVSLIQEIHEKTIDWRLNDRGPQMGSERVAILAVDEESLNLEGRWPWPRDKIAKLIDRTLMYGAKSISFDMIFSEEDNNSALPALLRLKKTLSAKSNDPIAAHLDEEESKADLDRIFANTIKASAPQLILGGFSDQEISPPVPGYYDLCLDAYFNRGYSNRYWRKEALPVTVVDPPLTQLGVPTGLKDHLDQYFTALEMSASATWFESHPELPEKIKIALDDLGAKFEANVYSGIAVLAARNDLENGKALLSQLDPAFNNPENVRTLFTRLASAMEKKEFAELKAKLEQASEDYCGRFFTESDELSKLDQFKKKWGDSQDAVDQYNANSWDSFWNDELKAHPQQTKGSLKEFVERMKNEGLKNLVPEVAGWTVNTPLLAEGTIHSGNFDAFQDTDGSIRRIRQLTRQGTTYAPSLALKTFMVDKKLNLVAKVDVEDTGKKGTGAKVLKSLDLNDSEGHTILSLPADAASRMMINYSGPRFMFPYVSASEMLSDSPRMKISMRDYDPKTKKWNINSEKEVVKRDFLKDKLLVLGATAIGIYDLRVTPFDENYPGVETHANALSNLLVEYARTKGEEIDSKAPGFLRAHPSEEKIMWIVLIILGLTTSALITYLGSVAGLGVTILAMSLIYAFDKFYLFKHGIVVAIIFPVGLVVTNFIALTFYKYFGEEKKKRELKGTFEKYVSPSIVAEVMADPSNIELGGKKVELTVMFSDVRGFTTISEKLDPRQLSDLLNSYLTPMTNLVFEHKGTLDKYMGDAIMSFWGAPIHFPDHATHACRCALAMLVKLRELQAEYRAKGLPEIDIGIGLNTGEMSVGNMGSDTVRSYTVMGDAVNLGSRLEGINKQYGTRIIISEFTYKEVKETFTCREIDWVRVKGKAQPVRIFELVLEGKASGDLAEVLKLFDEGFQLYHQKNFTSAIETFKKALAINPEDPCVQLYIERCEDYMTEAPDENWDGVFTMKTK